MDLTTAEAAALEPHLDLLHDLRLLTPGSAAQLTLSVLGAGLLSELADDDNLDSAPGM